MVCLDKNVEKFIKTAGHDCTGDFREFVVAPGKDRCKERDGNHTTLHLTTTFQQMYLTLRGVPSIPVNL